MEIYRQDIGKRRRSKRRQRPLRLDRLGVEKGMPATEDKGFPSGRRQS